MSATVLANRWVGVLALLAALLGALAARPGEAAEAKRPAGPITLTVIVETVAGGGEARLSPGVFAVYGPGQELRTSGPVFPDRPFTVTARPGDRLTFAVRVSAADLSIRPRDQGIELFTRAGRPATGNVTARLGLFDSDGMPAAGPQFASLPPLARVVRVTIH